MKRIERLSVWLLALCLSLSLCVPMALASQEEDGGVEDLAGLLSEEEAADLRGEVAAFRETYGAAFLLLTLESGTYTDLGEAAASCYAGGGYGYGGTETGFAMAYCADGGEAALRAFGAAADWVPEQHMRAAEEGAVEFAEEYGAWGALYYGFGYISSCLEELTAEEAPEDLAAADVARTDDPSLPDWYPADKGSFSFYHDGDALRVVDRAGIFTGNEAEQMEARISELRSELRRDIVIYTDTSSYGFEKKILAADFYDYNGYGCGPEREGVCLFICMDPADRGWWCCCTGPETMGLYTESVADRVDDELYEYMKAGDYARGVSTWIERIAMMYRKGDPFAPAWYPEAGETVERRHDPDAPRIVDDSGLLTGGEIDRLTAQAAEISSKYGIDVAIYVTPYPDNTDRQELSDLWYRVQGYGFGDGWDGILLTAFWQRGYYGATRITAEGKGRDKLSDVNLERLTGFCKDLLDEDEGYKAFSRYLTQLDHMERTGRVPRSKAYWTAMCVIGTLLGSLVGGIGLGGARSRMKTVRSAVDADHYLTVDSIRDLGDRLINRTTSRTYDPPAKKSSGGSSGRSSYSSSYSGSSGSSHSGSGRSF